MAGKTRRRSRGDGALYQRPDGLWVGTVDVGFTPEGKRRRKTVSGPTQKIALERLREVRAAKEKFGTVPTAVPTAAAWLLHWVEDIAAKRVRPNTLVGYRSMVVKHINPHLGNRRLDQITQAHVRAIHDAMIERGNSSTTALQCHRILSKALSDAMREGLVSRNVATLVDAPRKGVSTRGSLTAADAFTLLQSVNHDHYAASRWAAALFTGARQGELLGLERSRVGVNLDLSWQLQRLPYRHGCEKKRLDGGTEQPTCGIVAPSLCPAAELAVPAGFEYRRLEGGLCFVRPKSKAGHRVVPLEQPLRRILMTHIEMSDPGDYDLVWSYRGGPVSAGRDSKAWHAALDAAGIKSAPLHSARHTTATLLLEAGVDPVTIAAILGHSSVVVTQGYQHVSTALAGAALAALGASLSPPPPTLRA